MPYTAVPSPADLAASHVALAYRVAGTFARRAHSVGLDREDVRQEAVFGLLHAASAFDATKGAFTTLAWLRVKRHLLDVLRRRHELLRQFPTDPVTGEQVEPPDERRQAEVGAAADVEELLRGLDARRRLAVVLHYGLDGGGERTLADVGAALGVSGKRAQQLVASALQRLRAAAGQEDDAGTAAVASVGAGVG